MIQIDITFWKRVKYSLYSTLVFLILTNPVTHIFIQSMIPLPLLHNNIPSSLGYFVNGILFFLCILGLMMFPKD